MRGIRVTQPTCVKNAQRVEVHVTVQSSRGPGTIGRDRRDSRLDFLRAGHTPLGRLLSGLSRRLQAGCTHRQWLQVDPRALCLADREIDKSLTRGFLGYSSER